MRAEIRGAHPALIRSRTERLAYDRLITDRRLIAACWYGRRELAYDSGRHCGSEDTITHVTGLLRLECRT